MLWIYLNIYTYITTEHTCFFSTKVSFNKNYLVFFSEIDVRPGKILFIVLLLKIKDNFHWWPWFIVIVNQKSNQVSIWKLIWKRLESSHSYIFTKPLSANYRWRIVFYLWEKDQRKKKTLSKQLFNKTCLKNVPLIFCLIYLHWYGTISRCIF